MYFEPRHIERIAEDKKKYTRPTINLDQVVQKQHDAGQFVSTIYHREST